MTHHYAQITVAIDDKLDGGLEGFAEIAGPLPASVFHNAAADGEPTDQPRGFFAVMIDLMNGRYDQVGEKCISIAQAARIIGVADEQIIPMGRQRLAQINDEYAERRRAP